MDNAEMADDLNGIADWHHYTECGLENIFLKNGFRKVENDGQITLIVDDQPGLHLAIGKRLCNQRFLTGDEFKFLRKEMKMSQSRLGAVLGVTENMVSLWERRSAIPRHALAMVKAMYMEYIRESYQITSLLNTDSTTAANDQIYAEFEANWSLKMAA